MSKIKLTVILSLFIDILWFTIVIPALPDMVKYYNTSYFMISIWVTVFAFVWLFSTPILWAMSDKYGRKPILLFSVIWSFLSYVMVYFSPLFRVYMLSRIINWLSSWNIWAIQSIFSDISKDHKERTLNLWLFGAIFWISFIIWPWLWAFLMRWWIKAPFLLSMILCFINIIFILLRLPETNKLLDKVKKIKLNIVHIFQKMFISNEKKYYIIFFIINLAIMVYQTSFTLFLSERFHISWQMSWYILALFGLVMAINQGLFLKLWLKKFSSKRLVSISIMWMAITYLLAFLSGNMRVIIILVALSSIFQWLFRPVFQNIVLWQHQDVWTINWNMTAVTNLASIIWPIVWWYMIDQNISPFGLVAILMLLWYIYSKRTCAKQIE
jgi:DHA1 family tetracycline resistance protein-like MFS transporter